MPFVSPPSLHLEDLGLIEALKSECERFSQCPVRLEVNTRTFPMHCRRTWRCASFASRRRDCATLHATLEQAEQRFPCGAWTGGWNLP